MPSRRGVSIVVADDFPQFRRLIRSKLQQNGFDTVVEASDGIEEVATVAGLRPDLVLLDIEMPRLDGLKAAAQIRSICPRSKIIFISNNIDPQIARLALSNGAAGYVCKSDIQQELLPAMDAALALGGTKFVSARLRPYLTL